MAERDETSRPMPPNGTIYDPSQGGEPPPNSKLIALVDANVLRRLAVPIGDGVLQHIREDQRHTGTYLDLLVWLGQAPMVHRVIFTSVVEYECTRHIGGEIIPFGRHYPYFDRLADFFSRVPHVDAHHQLLLPEEEPESVPFPSRLEVLETPNGAFHLATIKGLYEKARRSGQYQTYLDTEGEQKGNFVLDILHYFAHRAQGWGEDTAIAYAIEERSKPGPAYYISADRASLDRIENKFTPMGSAIGVVNLTGLLKALLTSGYLYDHALTGDAPQPPKTFFDLMRHDINAKCLAEDGTNNAVPAYHYRRDQPGHYRDRTRGISLRDRLMGKAVWWSQDQAKPSQHVADVTESRQQEPDRDREIPN